MPVSLSVAQTTIPGDAVTASDLSDIQKDVIKRVVDAHKAGLSGQADKAKNEIKKSRNALLEPMQNAGISVQFRLYYSELLAKELKPLISSEREVVAINALRIAGELATTTSLDLLSDGLKDKRAGVRFAAVNGYESTFAAVERTPAAISKASQATAALGILKAAVAKESDAKVLEAVALAFQAASKVSSKKLEGVRGEAISSLSESIGAKAQAATDGRYDASFRRAANAARNALAAQDINEPALNGRVLKDAAGLAGDLLASVLRRVKSGELSVGVVDEAEQAALRKKRSELVLLVADSERTIQWAGNGLSAPNAVDLKLSDLLQQGKDDAFQSEVLRLIGANGSLTAAPFGFADNRFVK